MSRMQNYRAKETDTILFFFLVYDVIIIIIITNIFTLDQEIWKKNKSSTYQMYHLPSNQSDLTTP